MAGDSTKNEKSKIATQDDQNQENSNIAETENSQHIILKILQSPL